MNTIFYNIFKLNNIVKLKLIIMKNVILQLCLVLVLSACTENVEPSGKSSSVLEDVTSKSSDGAASGRVAPGSGGGGETGGVGFELTWNGDGRWHGNFGGSPVWFFGPTPTQLENGIQGDWETTCAFYTPNVCYPDGFTVSGNGSSFVVRKPACAIIGSVTIVMPKLIQKTSIISGITTNSWTSETRSITTFSAGNCSISAEGKIIVNENCKPMIVSPTSSYPANLCLGVQ
ncbi:MAG TPA: hypothetical protein PLS08_04900 [Chryseolinea sp.]|nr:hypothetical protein [Chryseolinea sp.]